LAHVNEPFQNSLKKVTPSIQLNFSSAKVELEFWTFLI
jgi:hypothetical protein